MRCVLILFGVLFVSGFANIVYFASLKSNEYDAFLGQYYDPVEYDSKRFKEYKGKQGLSGFKVQGWFRAKQSLYYDEGLDKYIYGASLLSR